MISCGKSFYKHCEKIFDFRNKLYDYVRNKEYQQSFIKSKSVNKTDLTSFFMSETKSSDANIAIKKEGDIIQYTSRNDIYLRHQKFNAS